MPKVHDTFAKRVQVRSVAALERASALILGYRQAQADAERALEIELDQVRQKHAARFQCHVGKKQKTTMPITERIEQLEKAVLKFTTGAKDKVFEEGEKTTRFGPAQNQVQVQLRDEAGRIEFLPGVNRRTSALAIVARTVGFQTALAKLLKKFGLAGWVVPAWDLDWDGLKRAIKAGEISDAELEAAGMYWEKPTRVRITKKG